MIEVFDMAQGSPEWYAVRLGLVTASEFGSVLAKGQGKMRRSYMLKLAGERVTGELAHSYVNRHMERGKALEDEAREAYAFVHDAEPVRVGFVRRGDAGCSPDAFLGDDGLLEIKTRLPGLMVDALLREDYPPEYVAQVQGGLWVTERAWADVVCYWPGMPLCVRRAYRDEPYIETLAAEIALFNNELLDMVARVQGHSALREMLERSAAA